MSEAIRCFSRNSATVFPVCFRMDRGSISPPCRRAVVALIELMASAGIMVLGMNPVTPVDAFDKAPVPGESHGRS